MGHCKESSLMNIEGCLEHVGGNKKVPMVRVQELQTFY
jgi:hypothetical protein